MPNATADGSFYLIEALTKIAEGNVMCVNHTNWTHLETVYAYQQLARAAIALATE